MRRESVAIQHGCGGREHGFVLVTMAIAAIALIGVLGLAVDVGRMFIAKNETQTYCDSAALAAALALDGTTTGVSSATAAVTNSANAWNLNTTKVSNPTVTFGTSISGPWLSNPSPADGYNFARVSATVPLAVVLYSHNRRSNCLKRGLIGDGGAGSPHFDSTRFGALHRGQHQYHGAELWFGGR